MAVIEKKKAQFDQALGKLLDTSDSQKVEKENLQLLDSILDSAKKGDAKAIETISKNVIANSKQLAKIAKGKRLHNYYLLIRSRKAC